METSQCESLSSNFLTNLQNQDDTHTNTGCLVTLISECCSRYEGSFFHHDRQDSIIILQNVTSYGTEGRGTNGFEIMPSNQVFEYMVFDRTQVKSILSSMRRGANIRQFPGSPRSNAPESDAIDATETFFSSIRPAPLSDLLLTHCRGASRSSAFGAVLPETIAKEMKLRDFTVDMVLLRDLWTIPRKFIITFKGILYYNTTMGPMFRNLCGTYHSQVHLLCFSLCRKMTRSDELLMEKLLVQKPRWMVIIGDVCCASEDGANEYAHDHEEPINDRVVDLTHPLLEVWIILSLRKQPRAMACLTHEKVAEIMAWLAAKVSITNTGQNILSA